MTDLRHYDVIVSPAITEKSTLVSETRTRWSSMSPGVLPSLKSRLLSKALFGVKVTAVNTLLRKGKTKRFRGIAGRQSDVKKAYVTLAEGQSIDVSTGL